MNVPLIASGGAGNMDHMHAALTEGKADAVLAASVFHFGELRIRDVKTFLSAKGLPIRSEG